MIDNNDRENRLCEALGVHFERIPLHVVGLSVKKNSRDPGRLVRHMESLRKSKSAGHFANSFRAACMRVPLRVSLHPSPLGTARCLSANRRSASG